MDESTPQQKRIAGPIGRAGRLPDAVRAIRARHYGPERAAPGVIARDLGLSYQKVAAILQPRQAFPAFTADAALLPAHPTPLRGEGGGPPFAQALPIPSPTPFEETGR
ncbi:hypothetical protein [Sphingomonas colocasiae]|uniref:Uncharacterized protein n=1 Tax=Sphingomonas colocasiae TaxID=1848973 RepID=A0ABS7PV82_9SPHN|nr:hypothetical protein [Sphingomonas colocasiae]MBY8825108.1 hypothetical protein [Sphingomonas colocasiae]